MQKNEKKIIELSLALAGIFQSAALIKHLARTGQVEDAVFEASIQTIYRVDAASVEQVYGRVTALQLGFQALVNILSHTKLAEDREVTRYIIGLMHLERKLNRATEVKNTLRRRIKHASYQTHYFASSPQTMINTLADIYLSTVGSLPVRLHVVGPGKYMNQPEVLSKIRALLLAGIRSAVLWRQLGGSRWQLFLMRNKLIGASKRLLATT